MIDPTSLVFYGMIGGFGYLGIREIRKMFLEVQRLNGIKVRDKAKVDRWAGMFDSLPMAIEQTEQMLMELKSRGVTDPNQLEPVEKRLKQLHMVAANQWWIEIAVKVLGPAADRMIKWVT